jgi:hypothetical protein
MEPQENATGGGTPTTRTRQPEDKLKAKLAKDLWFVVKWTEEEEELFDVLAAKDISGSGKEVCDVVEGAVGEGKFGKGWYPVRILGKGSYSSMLKARDELEEAVDSSGEAEPILTKDPSPAAVMEVEESSSNEDVVAVDFKTTSKKGGTLTLHSSTHGITGFCRCQTFYLAQKKMYAFVCINRLSSVHVPDSRSKTEAGTTKTPTKKPARMEVEQSSSDGYGSDTSFSDAVKTKKTKRDSTTSTPKRKRCPPKKGKGTPKNKKVKDSNVDDEAKDAKKAALAGLKAKSQGKDRENFENSMRIFSHLDSNKMTTGRPEGGSYDSPSWPSVYSSSSATAYHTSSLSPGMSDAGTSLPPSPPCGSASPSFPPFSGDPGFSWYLQEQRRTPFMPVPPRLSSSYSYPPAVIF